MSPAIGGLATDSEQSTVFSQDRKSQEMSLLVHRKLLKVVLFSCAIVVW